MAVRAAGEFRRTQAERDDQRLSWVRPDQGFFASGACHILAYVCRETYPDQVIRIMAMRDTGAEHASHVVASWREWSFDHCGWNRQGELLEANEAYDRRPLELIEITGDLLSFCEQHDHRPPDLYYADPRSRARDYVLQFEPPWRTEAGYSDG